jgi:mRNA interferase MazF
MINCKRGDVLLLIYPHSDLTTYSKRPALLVQADRLDTGLDQKVVAEITSKMHRTGPTRVRFLKNSAAGRQMGLLMDSVVVTDNLATVKDRAIEKVIGSCPTMAAVDSALRTTLAL